MAGQYPGYRSPEDGRDAKHEHSHSEVDTAEMHLWEKKLPRWPDTPVLDIDCTRLNKVMLPHKKREQTTKKQGGSTKL